MYFAPVLFRGIGHVANPSNSLVLTVLSASTSAYSANPKTKLASPSSLTGSAISLARNNARVLISGSLDMFSNRHPHSVLLIEVPQVWRSKSLKQKKLFTTCSFLFKNASTRELEMSNSSQRQANGSSMRGGILRSYAVNVKHHKVGEANEPGMYRINDDLEYSVDIYEWSGTSWKPYVADDVQLQFYMMSPYVLKTLSTDKKMFMEFSSSKFSTNVLDTLVYLLQNRSQFALRGIMSTRASFSTVRSLDYIHLFLYILQMPFERASSFHWRNVLSHILYLPFASAYMISFSLQMGAFFIFSFCVPVPQIDS
ncbi:hypothetical protein EJB05_13505, partial [Eragrostis curvula]